MREGAAPDARADDVVIPDSEEVQPGGSTTQLPLLQVADQQANHFSQIKLIEMPDGNERFEVHCNLPGLEELVGRFAKVEQCEAWQQGLLSAGSHSLQ